ncbi:Ser/Thr protein phosphatase superfamily protein [Dentipellis sp. KUC8613]|nr:Ser/Thr protein phosphatase superfamily protein [Dentipellis sp. KUC8613]
MKIQLLSDLHLECERSNAEPGKEFYHYEFPAAAEYLALLGDVGCTFQEEMFDWLRAQLPRFKRILFVPGNHEPYRSTIAESQARLKAFEHETNGRFILLNQTRYDLSPTVTVLGCTLWAALDPEYIDILSWALQDFKRIDDFNPETFVAMHRADVCWLNATIAQIAQDEPQRKVIVFTHHAPTIEGTTDPKFSGTNHPTNSAFATELTKETCWTAGNVTLWACGHTHWCCDLVRSGVRVVSNQRGYRDGGEGYDPTKVLVLED